MTATRLAVAFALVALMSVAGCSKDPTAAFDPIVKQAKEHPSVKARGKLSYDVKKSDSTIAPYQATVYWQLSEGSEVPDTTDSYGTVPGFKVPAGGYVGHYTFRDGKWNLESVKKVIGNESTAMEMDAELTGIFGVPK